MFCKFFWRKGVFKMKNKWFLILGVLLIFGSVFVSCDNGTNGDSGGGKLTITGLEEIDGLYIIAGNSGSSIALIGKGEGDQSNRGVLVSGGKAALTVYKITTNFETLQNEVSDYSGSDSNVKFSIYWKGNNSFGGWSTGTVSGLNKFGEVTVSFTNGAAQGQAQKE
jgi:hypothetical protein